MTEKLEPKKVKEFSDLLQTHGDLVYRMALQITGGQEADAGDLVQEAFLKIWKQWDQQRPNAFKGWMYRLMRNLFNDSMRKKYRRPTLSLDAPFDSLTALGDTLERVGHPLHASFPLAGRIRPLDEEMEKTELQKSVSRALLTLPVEFRIPVVLCDMADLSYEEIAAVLSCPVGTVRSRIHRGRVQLRELLKMHNMEVKS